MKLNKTVVAMALAGMAVAPIAQAEVTLSGQVAIGIQGSDADDSELVVFGDDSILNVAASGELDSGLTGYGNYRTDLALVGDSAVGDNIHLGIKGAFGDIRLGEVPDAIEYGQLGGDAYADIGGENAGISYTGAFGGATVGLTWSPEGSSDRIGAGVKFNYGGFGIGVGAGTVGEDSRLSAGATFALGGASVGVGFKDFDNERSTIAAKAGYGIGKTSLGVAFEAEAGDVDEGASLLRFDVGYDMGSSMTASARVNLVTGSDASDGAGDETNYRVLLTKAF